MTTFYVVDDQPFAWKHPVGARANPRCPARSLAAAAPTTQPPTRCPPTPVSSSKTATGAGPNAIWPAMPLTSTSRSSACPSTTPCATSPAYNPTTGGRSLTTPVRPKAGATAIIGPYDDTVEIQPEAAAYDASAVKNPPLASKSENEPAGSQPYDQSVAIRLQIMMPVRTKPPKPYDANSAIFTTSIKCVTTTDCSTEKNS